MFRLMMVATVGLLLAGPHAALAAEEKSPAQTAQQQKMKLCNEQASAKQLSGDPRKEFMKGCLSAKSEAAEPASNQTAQQQKMKLCNGQATEKQLTGDARKAFMSSCLKGGV